jgi:NADH-quinone oxidoreductase subunit H
VEYSSTLYLMIYLSEMANIILLSGLISVFFFGGWQAPFPTPFLAHWSPTAASFFGFFWFLLKTFFWFFMFAMVRVIVPRYRYDQLMRLGWKVFLPTSLVAVVLVSAWRVFAGGQGV